MSHSVEEMMTTDGEETTESVDFDTQLHQSHALHTGGDWVQGRLTNVRIRPVFTLAARIFDTYSISPTYHSIKEISTYKKSSVPATEPEPPFISDVDQKAPHTKLYLDSIDRPTRIVTSKEELFACDNSEAVTLIPTEDDDCYLLTAVEFELVAELESESLLKPHTVRLGKKRTVRAFQSLSIHSKLKESDSTKVKYKYNDDSLSIQYHRPNSKNWMNPSTITALYTLGVGVGLFQIWSTVTSFLQSTTPIPGLSHTVQSVNPLSGVMWSLFTLLGFIGIMYYGGKTAWRYLPTVKSAIANGEIERRIDGLSESVSTSLPYSKANAYAEEQHRIKEKAERLADAVHKYPRDVTVSPTDDGKKLTADNRSITWSVADGEVLNESSIDFFIEYGFDGDMEAIETHMVQDEEVVPDHLPALRSTGGDWYLLPEKIQVDPIISI